MYPKIGRPEKPLVDIPDYEDLVKVFESIHPMAAMVWGTKYLTGCRLNEWPTKINIHPEDENFLSVTVNTLKNPVQTMRAIPIDREQEADLIVMLRNFWKRHLVEGEFWVSGLKDKKPKSKDKELERKYKEYMEPHFPETYPHFLREFRIHHVIRNPKRLGLPIYREDQLCQYFGWSNFRSAAPYRHLREAKLL